MTELRRHNIGPIISAESANPTTTNYDIFALSTRLGVNVGLTVKLMNDAKFSIDGYVVSEVPTEQLLNELKQDSLCLVASSVSTTAKGLTIPADWMRAYIRALDNPIWIKKNGSVYVDLYEEPHFEYQYNNLCTTFYSQAQVHFLRGATPIYNDIFVPYRPIRGFWTVDDIEPINREYGAVHYYAVALSL